MSKKTAGNGDGAIGGVMGKRALETGYSLKVFEQARDGVAPLDAVRGMTAGIFAARLFGPGQRQTPQIHDDNA